MIIKCEYCGTEFTRGSSLRTHKETARYCLKLQGQACRKTQYQCQHCGKVYLRSDKYDQHVRSCTIPTETPTGIDVLYAENQRLSQQIIQLQSQITIMSTNKVGNINRNVVVNNPPPITNEEIQQHIDY